MRYAKSSPTEGRGIPAPSTPEARTLSHRSPIRWILDDWYCTMMVIPPSMEGRADQIRALFPETDIYFTADARKMESPDPSTWPRLAIGPRNDRSTPAPTPPPLPVPPADAVDRRDALLHRGRRLHRFAAKGHQGAKGSSHQKSHSRVRAHDHEFQSARRAVAFYPLLSAPKLAVAAGVVRGRRLRGSRRDGHCNQ